MSQLNFLLFGLYPYIAFAICLVGSWARFDLSQYTWKTGSSQMLAKKNMRLASNFFHIGIIFVLAGHFVGLLTPHAIYATVISQEAKQLVAMITGGLFGLMCLIGLVMLIARRFGNDRVSATSSTSDKFILIVLLVQLLLGLGTIVASAQHISHEGLTAASETMVLLGDWAQSIVTFQAFDAARAIEQVGLVYKVHVFIGVTLFVLFPFTRLVHIVSAPVWYLGRRYQIVRKKANI